MPARATTTESTMRAAFEATRDDQVNKRSLIHRTNAQRPLDTVPVVMFNEDVDIREVKKPSNAEFKNRWYSQGEYFYIKKEAMNTVRRMSTTKIREDERTCTRGLDMVEDTAVKRRKETIDSTVKLVLQEQEENNNPDEIAEIYKEMTSPCVEKSILAAQDDARAAACYQAEKQPSYSQKMRRRRMLRRIQSLSKLFRRSNR